MGAPLGLEVASSMGVCENQLYPPEDYPKRKAFIKYKNIKTLETYCQYGKNEDLTDCNEVPEDKVNSEVASEREKYQRKVLAKCMCTGGTKCKATLADSGVAAVSSTIFVRVALGTLLERFGPVNVQAMLLSFGTFWVSVAAAISDPWNFILIRFFIGTAGATFVTNQFWCSLMFAPNVIGTANATAAGWGNLGGGVTQIFMVAVLFNPFVAAGMSKNTAWRVAMFVPSFAFVFCALTIKFMCWDTPTKKRFDVADTGKTSSPSLWDYVECLKDFRVVVMIFQYSACFETELAMNNQLATHFRTYFQMKATDAGLLASSFGGMNLFARSLGGISSDLLFAKFGFSGRLWAQFLSLFFEAIFLFAFGCVNNEQPWYTALSVLIFFSIFVQMAEGTSYGIVPFMNPKQLAIISACVGAGGNLGAVIAGKCFYAPIEDELLPFKIHAGYVMFWALLSPVYYWPHLGGMFSGPKEQPESKPQEETSAPKTPEVVV